MARIKAIVHETLSNLKATTMLQLLKHFLFFAFLVTTDKYFR